MSASDSTHTPTLTQFLAAALAYHCGRMFRRDDGSWQIGDNASLRKVRVALTARGIEAWQPSTGRRIVWAA